MKAVVLSALAAAALLLAADRQSDASQPRPAAQSQREAGQSSESAPVSWRLCPGTSASVLVRQQAISRSEPPPPAAEQLGVALRLSRPLPRGAVRVERLKQPDGREAWLVHLQAPAGARPARYTGQLVILSGKSATRRPAVVEVLPFDLMRPSKQYAVTGVPITATECCLPEAAEVAALRRLHELGVGALCLAGTPADRSALEGKMHAAGLHGPVLAPAELLFGSESVAGHTAGETLRGFSAASPAARIGEAHARWYALCKTPPTSEMTARLRAAGALIACQADTTESSSAVDLPIFDAEGENGTRLARQSGASASGSPGWWRWDAGAATALENRLRCGALLWKSGLSGALVQIAPAAAADPAWPLRWAGVCDGIQDSRYLTTLYSLIRQVKDKDRSSPLPGQAEVAIAAALNGVAERSSPAAADRVREVAITWILRLGRLVWS